MGSRSRGRRGKGSGRIRHGTRTHLQQLRHQLEIIDVKSRRERVDKPRLFPARMGKCMRRSRPYGNVVAYSRIYGYFIFLSHPPLCHERPRASFPGNLSPPRRKTAPYRPVRDEECLVVHCISCQCAGGPVACGARMSSATPRRLSVLEPSSITRRVRSWPMRMMSPAWAGTKVMGWLGGARGDIVGGFG